MIALILTLPWTGVQAGVIVIGAILVVAGLVIALLGWSGAHRR